MNTYLNKAILKLFCVTADEDRLEVALSAIVGLAQSGQLNEKLFKEALAPKTNGFFGMFESSQEIEISKTELAVIASLTLSKLETPYEELLKKVLKQCVYAQYYREIVRILRVLALSRIDDIEISYKVFEIMTFPFTNKKGNECKPTMQYVMGLIVGMIDTINLLQQVGYDCTNFREVLPKALVSIACYDKIDLLKGPLDGGSKFENDFSQAIKKFVRPDGIINMFNFRAMKSILEMLEEKTKREKAELNIYGCLISDQLSHKIFSNLTSQSRRAVIIDAVAKYNIK